MSISKNVIFIEDSGAFLDMHPGEDTPVGAARSAECVNTTAAL